MSIDWYTLSLLEHEKELERDELQEEQQKKERLQEPKRVRSPSPPAPRVPAPQPLPAPQPQRSVPNNNSQRIPPQQPKERPREAPEKAASPLHAPPPRQPHPPQQNVYRLNQSQPVEQQPSRSGPRTNRRGFFMQEEPEPAVPASLLPASSPTPRGTTPGKPLSYSAPTVLDGNTPTPYPFENEDKEWFFAKLMQVDFKASKSLVLNSVRGSLRVSDGVDVEMKKMRERRFKAQEHAGVGWARFASVIMRDRFVELAMQRRVIIGNRAISAEPATNPEPGVFSSNKQDHFAAKRIFLGQFTAPADVNVTELKKWINCQVVFERQFQELRFVRSPTSGLIWEEENEQLITWKFKDLGSIKLVKLPPHISTTPFQMMISVRRAPRCSEILPTTAQGDSEMRATGEILGVDAKAVVNCQVVIIEFPNATAQGANNLFSTNDPLRNLFHTLQYLWKFNPRVHRNPAAFDQVRSSPGMTAADEKAVKIALRGFPFDVRMALKALLSTKVMSRAQLTPEFVKYIASMPANEAIQIMEIAASPFGNPCRIVERLKKIHAQLSRTRAFTSREVPPGMAWVQRVVITPLRRIYLSSFLEQTNRVWRQYVHPSQQNTTILIRVAFLEENLRELRSAGYSDRPSKADAMVAKKIIDLMTNGITICGKKFNFLAYSNSQLRDKSCWFMHSPTITPDSIRARMGNFNNITNVAKFGARLGQTLTTTTDVARDVAIVDIEDIKKGSYVFTDGCGLISPELWEQTCIIMGQTSYRPVAFQVRIGGYKGMVVLAPQLKGKVLHLPASMKKFDSIHRTLEVAASSGRQQGYLNRQIVGLLEHLGISIDTFLSYQRKQILEIQDIVSSPKMAAQLIRAYFESGVFTVLAKGLGENMLAVDEPFVQAMLSLLQIKLLHDLVAKARIKVEDSRTMKGVCDYTRILEYGQVFVQVTDEENVPRVITGKVVVLKNPALHEGDVLVLEAVDIPALHYLYDVCVFPVNGPRPHPNETSGGDLDGDDYFVCWNHQFVPPNRRPPMNFDHQTPMVAQSDLDVNALIRWFVDYLRSEPLGVIANALLAQADLGGYGHAKVQELAIMHSIAVDFPKSGIPALLDKELLPSRYPDFMQKSDRHVYASQKALGYLYREAKNVNIGGEWNSDNLYDWRAEFDEDDLRLDPDFVEVFTTQLENNDMFDIGEVQSLIDQYNQETLSLMRKYGIKNEVEVVTGCVIDAMRLFKRRKGNPKEDISHDVMTAFTEIKAKYMVKWWAEFVEIAVERQEEKIALLARCMAKACASYCLTYQQLGEELEDGSEDNVRRTRLLSFPWVVLGDLLLEYKQMRREGSGDGLSVLRRMREQLVDRVQRYRRAQQELGPTPK